MSTRRDWGDSIRLSTRLTLVIFNNIKNTCVSVLVTKSDSFDTCSSLFQDRSYLGMDWSWQQVVQKSYEIHPWHFWVTLDSWNLNTTCECYNTLLWYWWRDIYCVDVCPTRSSWLSGIGWSQFPQSMDVLFVYFVQEAQLLSCWVFGSVNTEISCYLLSG